jgi:hypothetical protein
MSFGINECYSLYTDSGSHNYGNTFSIVVSRLDIQIYKKVFIILVYLVS